MKSTQVSKENNDVKFTMEFSAEEFEEAIIKVYKSQKNRFQVDGFRKGKAPRSIIEKRYGEDIFFDDAINNMLSLNYPLALDNLDLEVIDQPRLELGEVKKGEGFTVTVEVACYPEIEIKDYKGVEIEEVKADVTDEDVEKELENVAARNSRMVAVDRPAKEGDTILIDYEGWADGEQFEGGTAERQPLKLGSNTFIPGFEEKLIGTVTGEEKDVEVTFPEDYHSEELAGKAAVFKCKVHEIKEQEIPEIDDEFVKDVSEFDTLEEYRESVREDLQKAADSRAENSMKNSIVEKIYDANDIDVPDAMVESEIDDMMKEFSQQLSQQGMNMDDYFKYLDQNPDEFRSELRENAYKKVKTRMIVRSIVEQENFEVSDDEINEEISKMAEQYGLEADKMRDIMGTQYVDMITTDIKSRKALDLMYITAVKTEAVSEEAASEQDE